MLMVSSAGVTFVFLEEFETDYGIGPWGIGLISALSFLSALATVLGFAPLGDRGHIGLLGGTGLALTIAGNLWIGFATELWSLSVSRALVGVGTGLFSIAARKALIGTTTEDSGQKIGTLLSAAVAGFIAGPGIGAWLASLGGIETPYLVIAALLTIAAPSGLIWLNSTPIAISTGSSRASMFRLLRRPRVRLALACQTAVFFNLGVFDSTVDKYLTSLGLGNVEVGWVLVIIGFPLLVIPARAGKFVDGMEFPGRLLVACTAVFVPIIFGMALWTVLAAFVVLAVIETTTESVIFPAAARVMVNETGAEDSAAGQGLLEVVGQAAAAIAAFAAPVLFDATDGPLGSFGMSGVVALVLVVYAASIIRSTSPAPALANSSAQQNSHPHVP